MSNRESQAGPHHDDEGTATETADNAATAVAVEDATTRAKEEKPEGEEKEPKHVMELEVEITNKGACKKHLKVTIPPTEIERQFDISLKSMRKDTLVPGFRPGRAPRGLVQKKFRKEVAGQVKSTLLLAALEQVETDHKLNAISQPKLDIEAIELKQDAPLVVEMDLEVQPEFPLPEYKNLTIERPIWTITEADAEAHFNDFLEGNAQKVPKPDGAAELGDLVTADLNFEKDGILVSQLKEREFRLQPSLQFRDGNVPDLAEALVGARIGDVREADAHISAASSDPAIRGQTIRVRFHVHDLKATRPPEVDELFLAKLGFETEAELREALRGVLERRRDFQQRQALRRTIVDQLIRQVPFELPADLVSRQEKTTRRNLVEELRRAGLSDSDIRAREVELRANAHEATLHNLKELFILARIAEAEELKVEPQDIDAEIERIAARTDESIRRVRSRIDKEGLTESLATQIIEQKAIDRILSYNTVKEVPMVPEQRAVETLEEAASAVAETETEEEATATGETAGNPEASESESTTPADAS